MQINLSLLFFISIFLLGCNNNQPIDGLSDSANEACDEKGHKYEAENSAGAAGLSGSKLSKPYGSNHKTLHYTWDMNEDGINDCEDDGMCDHTVDYSIPRYEIPGVNSGVVFDKRSGKWVDAFGICHTCTPENGFQKDGSLSEE